MVSLVCSFLSIAPFALYEMLLALRDIHQQCSNNVFWIFVVSFILLFPIVYVYYVLALLYKSLESKTELIMNPRNFTLCDKRVYYSSNEKEKVKSFTDEMSRSVS